MRSTRRCGANAAVRDARRAPARVPAWWPGVERSREVVVGALRWHVQHWDPVAPGAPVALLLHGTGAGTHSWRHFAPRLAARFEVLALDLPGHAFTETPATQALTLSAVARAIGALLAALDRRPALVIGHSAGAAIALRMTLDGHVAPTSLAAINGAILPLRGPMGRLFLPAARLLAGSPLVVPAFATWAALPRVTSHLLANTGSRIDAEGERCYSELVGRTSHVAGTLRLMASWDLTALARDLHRLRTAPLLVVGDNDRTLPPSHARQVQRQLPTARLVSLPRLGHLAHEEDAAAVLAPVLAAWEHDRGLVGTQSVQSDLH
jgi:magnesium chelatase accessory protein